VAVTRWDPRQDLLALHERINRLASTDEPGWMPPVDLRETADQYILTAEIAGLAQEDIQIQIQDGKLTLRGERRARDHGNHPFGALLTDAEGEVQLEAENTVVTESDCTGHAELNLIRQACADIDRDALAAATLYTSTEPCAMCSGAIHWGNVGRVVYALSEAGLLKLTGDTSGGFLNLPSREVFQRGGRPVEVDGPFIEEEARQVHLGFWR
jgi:tRNA(Arg) A34 adenosine deaminase TadA